MCCNNCSWGHGHHQNVHFDTGAVHLAGGNSHHACNNNFPQVSTHGNWQFNGHNNWQPNTHDNWNASAHQVNACGQHSSYAPALDLSQGVSSFNNLNSNVGCGNSWANNDHSFYSNNLHWNNNNSSSSNYELASHNFHHQPSSQYVSLDHSNSCNQQCNQQCC
jgi:hypothetical protein